MLEYKPYTYLIGWSAHNTYYYGVEFSNKKKIANPQNLWITYFTSSRYVAEARLKYGEPDIIQVRKIFSSKEKAQSWEQRVISRCKLHLKENFLNKACGTLINFDDDEVKLKMSIAAKRSRRPLSNDTKIKLSSSLKNKWKDNGHHCKNVKLNNDHKNAISEGVKKSERYKDALEAGLTKHIGENNGMFGKKHTKESRKKMSEKCKNRKLIKCNVCGAEVTSQTLGRYHKHDSE